MRLEGASARTIASCQFQPPICPSDAACIVVILGGACHTTNNMSPAHTESLDGLEIGGIVQFHQSRHTDVFIVTPSFVLQTWCEIVKRINLIKINKENRKNKNITTELEGARAPRQPRLTRSLPASHQ